jgi:hypothetical protein
MADSYDSEEGEERLYNHEVEENEKELDSKAQLLVSNHVHSTKSETDSIQRARKKSAQQVGILNQKKKKKPHAVPIPSYMQKKVSFAQRRGGGIDHENRLIDWINNNNAVYSEMMSQACRDGQITGNIAGEPSPKKQSGECLAKQIQNFRQNFTHSDMEGLERAAIVEAAHCMTQLCSPHVLALSNAISGTSVSHRSGDYETAPLDVNTSIGSFYETYVILSIAEPWKLDTNDTVQHQKMKAHLDELWKEVEETKNKFVLDSKIESGITAQDNHRCTLQDLSDHLLELSIFVRSCIDLGKDNKSSWFFTKK